MAHKMGLFGRTTPPSGLTNNILQPSKLVILIQTTAWWDLTIEHIIIPFFRANVHSENSTAYMESQ